MTAGRLLLETWRRTCSLGPDAPAVVEAAADRRWTRGELDARARQSAAALPDELRQRRVVFACANGAEWMTRCLALLERGAVPVPLDPTEPPDRQAALGRDIGAVAAWDDAGLRELAPDRAARDRDAALIKLTSGSTGRPRPLRFRAEELLADGRQVCVTMGLQPEDLNLALIPLGHSYGLGNLVLPLLDQGTAFVVPASALPQDLAECCRRWAPTVFPAVPALLRLLAESALEPDAFQSLRTVISAGAPLPPATAERFLARFGRRVHGFYGSSETGGIAYDRTGDASLAGRSVGTPLAHVDVLPARGGRLLVRSAAVYTLGNPRARGGKTGSFSPADLAVLDANGEVVLRGRTGRLAKIAGRRIDLGAIERELEAIPGVRQAFAMVDPSRPDDLAVAVAGSIVEAELRRRLAADWPAWKVPRRLVVMDALPLTARGKVDAAALHARLGGR